MEKHNASKYAMVESLKKLMRKKELSKITIREITDDSGYNRQTFYYHFSDIYDMVRWMYKDAEQKLLAKHNDASTWQEGMLDLFKYIQENKQICVCTLNSMGHTYLKELFYTDIYHVIEKVADAYIEKVAGVSQKYKKFIIHYYTISLGALLVSWISDEIDQTPEDIIEFIGDLIEDQVKGAALRNKKRR